MRKLLILPLFIALFLTQVRGNACSLDSSKVSGIEDALRKGKACTDSVHSVCTWGGSGKVNKKFTPSPFDMLKSTSNKKSEFNLFLYSFPSPEAEAAFKYAISIWEQSLSAAAPINVFAYWTRDINPYALAGCSPSGYEKSFYGETLGNTSYPNALHKKLTYTTNADALDMTIVINSNRENWYFGTDGDTPEDSYDFVTVILHELAHGLGMVGTCDGSKFNYDNSIAYSVFDRHLVDSSNNKIDNSQLYPNNSSQLEEVLQDQLFFNGSLAKKANNNNHVELNAPDEFLAGSSIYHLHDMYNQDDENSLLTFQLDLGRAIHTPGPVLLAMLGDLGWDVADISHQVKDFDNAAVNSKDITFNVSSEYTVDQVKVYYKQTGDEAFTEATVVSNGGNEYLATFENLVYNNDYKYYIEIKDTKLGNERTFSYPANAKIKPSTFSFGPDVINPELEVLTKEVTVWMPYASSFTVQASASDNYAVESVAVQLVVDGIDQADVLMELNPETNLYESEINLPDGITNQNIVAYRVVASDKASIQNTTTMPEDGELYQLTLVQFSELEGDYATTFEEEGAAQDFHLYGMKVLAPSNDFEGKSLNTAHPYDLLQNYVATLCYEIPVTAGTKITYDEIVLVEKATDGIIYPSVYFYDYAVVEVSEDHGETWTELIDGYDSGEYAPWNDLWNSFVETGDNLPPNSFAFPKPEHFVTKEIDLVNDTHLEEGDNVLIRFRLSSDNIIFGWGWCIDNLSIVHEEVQDISVQRNGLESLSVVPNPANDNITIKGYGVYKLEVFNLSGTKLKTLNVNGNQPIYIGDLLKGVYLIKIKGEGGSITKKLLKQ